MTEAISILYVEDNPADARLLKEYLAESCPECRLHTAASLSETLDYLAGNPVVDVILCDLSLPDSQGLDTFRKIHSRARDIPMLVLSGLADEEIALKAVHEGAQDYLVKGRLNGDALSRAVRYSLERDRAAKALRESEKRYRSVGELVPFGVWTAGIDGGITYLSDVFLDMVGMSLDQCKGYGWTERVHPEDATKMASAWKECVRDETPWDYEYRIRDRFGDYRTVLSRGTPVRGAQGQVISWSGINLDITERRSYVEALGDSMQQLDTVVNTTHILLAYMDPQFNFIWVNKAYAESDEKDPSYFPGKNHFDLFPYGDNDKIFAEVVRTGEPYYAYARAFEYADHPERGVSYWDWSVVPTKDGDGTVMGLLFSLADVTERIRMQDSLKISEEKYRLLVETVNSVIVVTQDGVVKFINDQIEGLLGYTTEEIVGKEAATLFTDDEKERLLERYLVRVSGTMLPPTTYRMRHKNGDIRHVEVGGTLMLWEGRPALLDFAVDVTERVRAQEALLESERRYHSLFQNMLDGFAYHQMIFDEEDKPVDYTYLEANDAFERLTGLKAVVGKRVTEILPDIREENPELLEIYGRVALTGAPEEFETYVPTLKKWFSVSVYSPQKGYFVTVFENITERKRAEETLREAQLLSEGLNRINEVLHSSLDIGRIVRSLVDEGAKMLGSETAALSLRLAGHWTVAYVHGMPENLVGTRMTDKQERLAALALESRHPVAIADAYKDERVDRRHMKKHGIRAVLVAPLIVRNEPFGVILFNQHTAPREFTDAQVDFAAQLASTAAIALENSRLYDEQKKAEEELRRNAGMNAALAELYEPLTSPGATIQNITEVVLKKALDLTGSAHGFVAEIDPLSADSLVHAITNMFPKQREAQGKDHRIRFPHGKDGRYGGLWGYALNTREAFFTNHPETHPAARGVPKGHGRIERFLSVPVLLGSELVGQIALANPERDYSERDIDAVQRLAEFYALAIQRVRAEETIVQSLAEKEALLREIHHRVKNNLQTVSSLLSMAGMGAKNKEASVLLRDAESRVHVMALIHSQLYGSQQLDRIDVKRNIRELTDRLSSIYSASARGIAHSVEGDDVSLTIHQAIPCALAVNEIVTNAFKYAFEGRQAGTITVVVGRKKDAVSIAIVDDGVGLPDGFDVESADTLGVRLVKNLIEGQLAGQVDFASSKGTSVSMSFRMEGREGVRSEGHSR